MQTLWQLLQLVPCAIMAIWILLHKDIVPLYVTICAWITGGIIAFVIVALFIIANGKEKKSK